jgi:hypothetical protein
MTVIWYKKTDVFMYPGGRYPMKKWLTVILFVALSVSMLAGCDNNKDKKDSRVVWMYTIEDGT